MTTLQEPAAVERAPDASLAPGKISLPGVLFVAVATMAPGAGAAYAIGTGASFAGGSLPLSVIVALVGSLLVAIGIGQMAKHMSSAGGLASYVGTAFHPGVGYLVAWAYPFAYLFVLPYLALVFGNLLATAIAPHNPTAFHVLWIVGGAVCLGLAFAMNYFGVEFGARLGLILGVSEIVVLVVMSIWMIFAAGGHNTASVFTTHHATVSGFSGTSGVIAGSVYGFLAFIGFEAAAPLAEETANPRRNIPRAVVGSALFVGLFFVLTTYSSDVYFGVSKMPGFLAYNDGNAWIGLARNLWGAGWIVLLITLLNSALACSNGASMAATRSLWSMGQSKTAPKLFAYTHPKYRSPVGASGVLFGVGALLTFWLGEQWSPVTAYSVFGTVLTIAILPIYVLAALACPVYYLRYRRSELNWALHVVAPILGAAFLVPAFATGAGIRVFSFVSSLSYPINLAGPIVGGWYLLGIGAMIYLVVRHRERLADLAASHISEPAVPVAGLVPSPRVEALPLTPSPVVE